MFLSDAFVKKFGTKPGCLYVYVPHTDPPTPIADGYGFSGGGLSPDKMSKLLNDPANSYVGESIGSIVKATTIDVWLVCRNPDGTVTTTPVGALRVP